MPTVERALERGRREPVEMYQNRPPFSRRTALSMHQRMNNFPEAEAHTLGSATRGPIDSEQWALLDLNLDRSGLRFGPLRQRQREHAVDVLRLDVLAVDELRQRERAR